MMPNWSLAHFTAEPATAMDPLLGNTTEYLLMRILVFDLEIQIPLWSIIRYQI